jgi:hypothetical protein
VIAAPTLGATYCGAPPDPSALAARFNFDPVLIAALLHFQGAASIALASLVSA